MAFLLKILVKRERENYLDFNRLENCEKEIKGILENRR